MKIILPATVIVCGMANQAMAVTLAEKENLTIEINGDLQIQLLQKSGEEEDLDVNFDDGEIKNTIEYDLGSGLTAFGQLDFEISKDEELTREEAYVGMAFGGLSFLIGTTDYVTDDFGVENNIDVPDVDRDAFLENGSDDVLLFRYDANNFSVGVSHDLEVGDEDNDGNASDDLTSTDLYLETEFGSIALAFAYQLLGNYAVELADGTESTVDVDTVGLSAVYDTGVAEVGIAYSVADIDADGVDEIENTSLAISVPIASEVELGLGFDTMNQGDTSVDSIYGNVVYTFPEADNVSTFAEIGQKDEDNTDNDVGFLAGLRIKF